MIKTLYLFLFFMLILLSSPVINGIDFVGLKQGYINVEIKGAVDKPDIYQIEAYSTIDEVLSLVQLDENADLSRINLTTVLKDNDVIVIDTITQEKLISINNASIDQLTQLPSIGEVIAQRIIEYRYLNGPFQKLEDIKNVKGIGDKTFEKIKELICL